MASPATNAYSEGTEGAQATPSPVSIALTSRLRVTSKAGL